MIIFFKVFDEIFKISEILIYKNNRREVPLVTTEQPVIAGMKKNKSDTNLELLELA